MVFHHAVEQSISDSGGAWCGDHDCWAIEQRSIVSICSYSGAVCCWSTQGLSGADVDNKYVTVMYSAFVRSAGSLCSMITLRAPFRR